ncbi:MAG: S-layer homology domain-containing protein [Clostridia bacterium]|nr:S-layer homology domain-containing protein [Clostridia bacterium]
MKFRKFLSVALALAMIFALSATVGTAFADGAPSESGGDGPVTETGAYRLWVNNEQLTDDHLTVQCGEGTATFDPAANVLTLDNAQITRGYEEDQLGTGILSFLDEELTIIVKGDCTITETGGDGIGSYDMDDEYQMVPHDFTVKGDGKLTITESEPWYGYGFYCTGSLTLDGVDIEIVSVASGVWANRSLTVQNSKLNVKCSTQFSGFVVNNGSAEFKNSEVYAESANGAGFLLGNDQDSSYLLVSSGDVTLKGKIGAASDTDNSTVSVTGGKLTIEGQDAAFSENFLTDVDQHILLGDGVEVTSGSVDGAAVTFASSSSHVHSYDEAVTDPTCTEQGFITHTCSCGDSYVDTYVDALGHDYEDAVTAPTCTERGYTTHTCSRCGDSYVDNYVDASGHTFGSDGKAEKCTVCGEKNPDYKPPVNFKDVVPGAYYADAVAWAVANGITTGTSATTFSPEDGCTRGQVVTFLWRTAGSPEPTGARNPFRDVKESDYFYKAVLWAVENEITVGTSANEFSPEDVCTRGQIVTFLWRSNGKPSPAITKNPFLDVSTADYFHTAVLWAVEKKITLGTDATHFSPSDTCTRGQVVTFLYRDANS